MQKQRLKLELERILVPETYPSNPYEFELPVSEWEPWLKLQQRKATWRKKTGHKKPATGTRIKVQWSERWECDHAGNRRDRRKAGVSPSRCRTRAPSIKIGCTANYAIDLPHTIVPSCRSRDIEEEETLEAHHAYKRRMISKLREEITELGLESYWVRGETQDMVSALK
ncbi:hypothetical protein M422DRAFT_270503 [Sphaerobolus stellatus SS14]|uniref:Uncharacterized protein n=1 Tax=Sphaerobolus stellatus (strain SS14) TaxID=990650 RepID=A0A0C9USQ7_SPHS4|nr:hypothetical protein M422DRAFT_270503 [Sphaerobolus stellatus SS14]